jgi:hypothetical protein
MAVQQPTPQPGQPRDLFERLAHQTREIAYVLLGLGLAAVVGAFLFNYRFSNPLLFTLWAAALAATFLGFGIYTLVRASQPGLTVAPDTWIRLLTALVGGLVGFFTALLGLLLPFTQPYKSVFVAGLSEWRQHPWYLVLVGGSLFGGLTLMFVSLQLTRPFERSRAELRRLVYGFNAVLGVLLLFLVLGLVNVLGYSNVQPFTYLGKTTDWTASSIYTLKDSSVNALRALDRPVKIYVLMNTRGDAELNALREIETLLDNCRRVSDRLNYEVISPHSSPRRMEELAKTYGLPPTADFGMLVVYGDGPSAPSQFISFRELFIVRGNPESGDFTFRGEGVLIRTVEYLKSGKSKVKIYITQGHGEPDLRNQEEGGLATLNRFLSNPNSQVVPLNLTGADPKVPEDATVVVVAGPHQKLSVKAVSALAQYSRGEPKLGAKKGKLLVMLDPVEQGGQWIESGLENFLRDQGVQVVQDRVLRIGDDPTIFLAVPDSGSQSKLAKAFATREFAFQLENARSVNILPPTEATRGVQTESLLIPFRGHPVWSETRLNINPVEVAQALARDDATAEKMVQEHPVKSVAVTVSDESGPRMVVFGGSTWVTNAGLSSQFRSYNLALFISCTKWLSGAADLGETAPEGAARTPWVLTTPEGELLRLQFLPLVLMLLGVCALGTSVWVVRRR